MGLRGPSDTEVARGLSWCRCADGTRFARSLRASVSVTFRIVRSVDDLRPIFSRGAITNLCRPPASRVCVALCRCRSLNVVRAHDRAPLRSVWSLVTANRERDSTVRV